MQTLSIASAWANPPGSTASVWPIPRRGKSFNPPNPHNPGQPSSPPFTSLTPRGLLNHTSGSGEAQAAAMSEAYFRVESGALGLQENFLSLDDILMSHEKLPVRTEIPMPRLGAFFLERSVGADTDNAIPPVSILARPRAKRLQLPVGLARKNYNSRWASRLWGAAAPGALPSGICIQF